MIESISRLTNCLPEEMHTPRLFIRVAKPGDGRILNKAIAESVDHLIPWLDWVTPRPGLADSEFSCRRAWVRFLLNEDLTVFFFLKDTGTLIGGGGLHNIKWDLRQFELGYWGHRQFVGMGLVTEGVQALVQEALMHLHASKIFLTTDSMNVASRQLAERVGFQLEGILKRERPGRGRRMRDTCVYAVPGTGRKALQLY